MRSHSWLSFALAMTLVGCSRGGSSDTLSLPTIPIATEAAVTIAPSTVPPTIAAVAPTEVEVVPSTAVVAPPTAVYDYSKIPVLVRFTPKDAGEQEIVNALKILLPNENTIEMNIEITRSLVDSVFTTPNVEGILQRSAESTADGVRSRRGPIDRMVIGGVSRIDDARASARVCYVNNGVLYREGDSTTSVVDATTVTRSLVFLLSKSEDLWKIAEVQEPSKTVGSDQCEH